MIFATPVVIATVVVGVLLATSLALFDKRSAPSLLGDAGVGVLAGVVIWVALAWVSFYLTGKFPAQRCSRLTSWGAPSRSLWQVSLQLS